MKQCERHRPEGASRRMNARYASGRASFGASKTATEEWKKPRNCGRVLRLSSELLLARAGGSSCTVNLHFRQVLRWLHCIGDPKKRLSGVIRIRGNCKSRGQYCLLPRFHNSGGDVWAGMSRNLHISKREKRASVTFEILLPIHLFRVVLLYVELFIAFSNKFFWINAYIIING